MDTRSDQFWMGGISASSLLEISHDPAVLGDGDFWAVTVDYEGRWTCAKFADISHEEFVASDETSSWSAANSQWRTSQSSDEYKRYVERIRKAIGDGEIYQANACLIYSRPNREPLDALFTELLKRNPAPYASYLSLPNIQIASASPELFLEMRSDGDERRIKSSPIKGTSKTDSFLEKDYPENIMIVDLMRNDFGAICEVGSVSTPRLLATEEHPGLFHLVSDIEGVLREEVTWTDISNSILPAGSISGAPKSRAIKIIAANEGERGIYTGLIGWVHGDRCELAVAIRTFWQTGDDLHFGVGAGITWGSDPELEWNEVQLKASRFLEIAGGILEP